MGRVAHPKQVVTLKPGRRASLRLPNPESSVCQEKLIFFGCEIVVVYTSRHFVQIRESETAAAGAALLRFLCDDDADDVGRRRELTSGFFSISSPKDTRESRRGTPATTGRLRWRWLRRRRRLLHQWELAVLGSERMVVDKTSVGWRGIGRNNHPRSVCGARWGLLSPFDRFGGMSDRA